MRPRPRLHVGLLGLLLCLPPTLGMSSGGKGLVSSGVLTVLPQHTVVSLDEGVTWVTTRPLVMPPAMPSLWELCGRG